MSTKEKRIPLEIIYSPTITLAKHSLTTSRPLTIEAITGAEEGGRVSGLNACLTDIIDPRDCFCATAVSIIRPIPADIPSRGSQLAALPCCLKTNKKKKRFVCVTNKQVLSLWCLISPQRRRQGGLYVCHHYCSSRLETDLETTF